jgi:DedD protein
MSAENKKFLWISLSVCAFVLALAATGLVLFAPKKGGAAAPATVGNVAAPKSADPQDFLQAPPPAPSFEQPRSAAGDVVVVYGDKPTALDGSVGEAPAAGAASPAEAAPLPSAAPAVSAPAASPKAVAKPQPTAPKAPASPAKVQSPKKVKADEYWIQAASFASRGKADELKDSLAAKGIACIISVKDIDGKSWYRVRIGPYSGKAEAEGWLSRLKALPGCSEAFISKTVVERNG